MPKLLTAQQVAAYDRDGYVFPIDVLSASEVAQARSELENWERENGKAIDFPEKSKSYLLFEWADRLVHHPRILDAVEDVIGSDILVYHPTLFLKEARTPRLRALAPRQHLLLPGAPPARDRVGGAVGCERGRWLHAGAAGKPPLGRI